ncbi:MAG TPA: hypothetical protein VL371_25205, partial [Gemmataceae bacterium]|nr:hypothetical protein [Gemmataceae bacterium]
MTNRLFRRLVTGGAMCVVAALAVTSAGPARAADAVSDPAAQLDTLPGFKVEHVLKADPKANGSWISLGKDNKGRLLLGGQARQPLTRVTIEDGKVAKQDVLKLPVSEIMCSLWAFDSLYADGQKDGKLYTVCGNFVDVPADVSPNSPHRNYADDLVLPRAEDGNGFGAGKKPPGGFVLRMDPDGKNAELFASGQRNTYDIALNADGEIVGFDSDMEWDWGMPWYRPIRIFHAVSGGDTGFREGSAKWPTYYFDSLPPVVNIGIGSPTGVVFGY